MNTLLVVAGVWVEEVDLPKLGRRESSAQGAEASLILVCHDLAVQIHPQ